MSDFIGVIRNAVTGQIMAVINPDDDSELDNPRWLLLRKEQAEPMEMIRVPRGDYMGLMSTDQLAALVESLGSKR